MSRQFCGSDLWGLLIRMNWLKLVSYQSIWKEHSYLIHIRELACPRAGSHAQAARSLNLTNTTTTSTPEEHHLQCRLSILTFALNNNQHEALQPQPQRQWRELERDLFGFNLYNEHIIRGARVFSVRGFYHQEHTPVGATMDLVDRRVPLSSSFAPLCLSLAAAPALASLLIGMVYGIGRNVL